MALRVRAPRVGRWPIAIWRGGLRGARALPPAMPPMPGGGVPPAMAPNKPRCFDVSGLPRTVPSERIAFAFVGVGPFDLGGVAIFGLGPPTALPRLAMFDSYIPI